jgi:F420-non-reducing hydrogenase iron-sulfur subunit
MEERNLALNVTIFFCRRLDPKQDTNRRALERELGSRIKFFPLPCSGRIEPLHLMRALEAGADKVYLITCPGGACRYGEGNFRANKRLAFTQGLLEEIGIERERLEIIRSDSSEPTTIDKIARDLLMRESAMGPSPVRIGRNGGKEADKQREVRA